MSSFNVGMPARLASKVTNKAASGKQVRRSSRLIERLLEGKRYIASLYSSLMMFSTGKHRLTSERRRQILRARLGMNLEQLEGRAMMAAELTGTLYTQDFDSLPQTGTFVNADLPAGWAFAESGSGANATGTAGTGSATTGDTYSFGVAGANAVSDRAFGGLLSGSLTPTIGAAFTNNTGSTVTSITIGYTGELWRTGQANLQDRLDFQFSTDATDLTSGTWTNVDALDFVAPSSTTTGAKDGNDPANRVVIAPVTINGLSIPQGATFRIRWTDFNITGSDSGLAVDDFSINVSSSFVAAPVTLTAGDIAFTSYRSDAPDGFSFVILKDVTETTTLTFTDRGWLGAQNGFGTSTEDSLTVTFGADYPAGTQFSVIDINDNANGNRSPQFRVVSTNLSAGLTVGNLGSLSADGDSLLAYQGSLPTTGDSPAWIAGLIQNAAGAWNETFDGTGTNDSALPTALANGSTAVAIGTLDNGALNATTFPTITGTASEIRAIVNNVANWVTSDAPSAGTETPAITFTVNPGSEENPPAISSPTSASITETTAVLGGNVTSDGGAAITERGVIYAKTSDDSTPTLAEVNGTTVIKVAMAGTTGVFAEEVTGLEASTSYSFVAFATNSEGTTITSVGTFTTSTPAGSNQAPSGTDNTVTIDEDASHAFEAADFGFSDPDTNNFLAVTITTLPAVGTLRLNGVDVTAGQSIPVDDIPDLEFTPVANAFGTNYASFTFQVQDDGGTANGGIDLDPTPNTITFNVTAVNDAPVVTTNRTLVLNPGQSVSITGAILLATDVDNNNASLTYTVTTGPTKGTITKNAAAITSFTQTDLIASDTLSGSIRYNATTAVAGETDSITVSLSDGTATVTDIVINISIVAPTAPVDFTGTYSQNFNDLLPTPIPGSNLSMPAAQILPQGWSIAETGTNANDSVRIDSGNQSTGDTFFYGAVDSNERALGSQGSGSLTTARFGVALTNTTGNTITTLNVAYVGELWRNGVASTVNTMTFDYSDTATGIGSGTYTAVTSLDFVAPEAATTGALDGNLPANQVNVSGAITGLTWAPGETIYLRWTDTDSPGADDGLAIDDLSITVGNTAPTQVANAGLAIDGEATETITTAMLEYSDLEQAAADLTYTVTTVPAAGELRLNGTALANGETFTQADINSGLVTYLAGNTTNNLTFAFTVSDGQGGSASGSFAIAVTAAGNAAPTVPTNAGLTLDEGASSPISNLELAAADDNDTPVQLVFTVTVAPANGSILVDGVAASSFTQADINNNLVSYAHDGSETTSDSFSFIVTDSGSASTTTQVFNITVTPVNDAPVLTNNTGLTATWGDTAVIGSAQLLVSDVDNTPAEIIYTVTSIPTGGALQVNGVDVLANGTFTQADVNAGLVSYVAPVAGTTDGFDFSVTDGAATPLTGTLNITLSSVVQVYINEIMFNPPGADAPHEYVELRGEPNAVISSGTYLLGIEGDNGGNPGDVQNIFNLSGMSFGSNGLLLILQKGNSYDVAAIQAAGTNVVVNTGSGSGFGSALGSSVGHSADSNSGDIENASVTFMVIRSAIAPTLTTDIDTVGGAGDVGDGTPDGPEYASWQIMDSIGILDGTEAAGDFSYGAINFANSAGGGASTTGPVVQIGGTAAVVARIGDGSTASDWIVGDVAGTSPSAVTFGLTGALVSDAAFRGSPLNHVGLPNNFTLVAPTDIALSATEVDEDVAIGTVVGTFTTTDPTVGDTHTYSLVSGDGSSGNAAFTIVDNELRTAVELTQASYSVRVRTTDAGGVTFEKSFVISVNSVVNLPPAFDQANYAFDLDVQSISGEVVGTVTATDPENDPLVFALVDSDPQFAIDPATGEITLGMGPILLPAPGQTIELTASVSDGTSTVTVPVVVTITGVLDNNPPVIAPDQVFTINSKVANLALAGVVAATDADAGQTLTYAITGGTSAAAFTIDSATGAIRVANAKALPKIPKGSTTLDLVLQVTVSDNYDPVASTTADVTVRLSTANVRMNPTVNPATFTLAENNKKTDGTTKVGAIKPIAAYGGQKFAFQALSGADAASFNINAKGGITLASGVSLDFETKPTYTFNVNVADSLDPTKVTTQVVTLNVRNINEAPVYTLVDGAGNPVAIEKGKATIALDENIPGNATKNGLVIATLTASDQDQLAETLKYQQNNKGATIVLDKTGAFAYNPVTGEITIVDETKVDFEARKAIKLSFIVTDDPIAGDAKSKAISTKLTVTVALNDLNEAPVISSPDTFTISENNKAGAKVGSVKAKDADKTKQTLTYTIQNQTDAAGAAVAIFGIDAKGGINIPTARALNFEQSAFYTLVVRVTDSGIPTLFTEQTITVNVRDLNEAATFALTDALGATATALTLSRAAIANDDVVGNLQITDVDAGAAGTYAPGSITTAVVAASKGGLTYDEATGDLIVLDVTKLTKTFDLKLSLKDSAAKPVTSKFAAKVNIIA